MLLTNFIQPLCRPEQNLVTNPRRSNYRCRLVGITVKKEADIKSMKRSTSMAISKEGKKQASKRFLFLLFIVQGVIPFQLIL